MPFVRLRIAVCAAAALLLAGCAGMKGAPVPSAEQLKVSCPQLAGQTIAASAIALPSGSAAITSSAVVPAVPEALAGGVTTPATPDYCRVLGSIAPVDPAAQSRSTSRSTCR
jgi:hypothetical protein